MKFFKKIISDPTGALLSDVKVTCRGFVWLIKQVFRRSIGYQQPNQFNERTGRRAFFGGRYTPNHLTRQVAKQRRRESVQKKQ